MESMLGGVESRMREETAGMRQLMESQLCELKGEGGEPGEADGRDRQQR